MSNRITKVSTKAGDSGKTSLATNRRVLKSDPTVEVLGELDALNVAFGWVSSELHGAISKGHTEEFTAHALLLQRMQSALLDIGAQVASEQQESRLDPRLLGDMEVLIESLVATLGPLKEFILPSGTVLSLCAHDARVQVRAMERKWVAFRETIGGFGLTPSAGETDPTMAWFNRSSDYFFQLARYANLVFKTKELQWVAQQK